MKPIAVITKDDGVLPVGICFEGALIAHVSSKDVLRMIGEATGLCEGRWQELNLYRANTGKFICQRIYRTQREGERDAYEGQICDDHSSVIKFFGDGWLARELYQEAGIAIGDLSLSTIQANSSLEPMRDQKTELN